MIEQVQQAHVRRPDRRAQGEDEQEDVAGHVADHPAQARRNDGPDDAAARFQAVERLRAGRVAQMPPGDADDEQQSRPARKVGPRVLRPALDQHDADRAQEEREQPRAHPDQPAQAVYQRLPRDAGARADDQADQQDQSQGHQGQPPDVVGEPVVVARRARAACFGRLRGARLARGGLVGRRFDGHTSVLPRLFCLLLYQKSRSYPMPAAYAGDEASSGIIHPSCRPACCPRS